MLEEYNKAVVKQSIEWSSQHDFLCSNRLAVQHAYFVYNMELYSTIEN